MTGDKKMRFNLKKTLIILAAISISSFAIAMVIIASTEGLASTRTFHKEEVFKASEVKNIDINTTASINIFSADDGYIKIDLSGVYNTSIEEDIPELVAYLDGNVLSLGIKVKPSRRVFVGVREMTAELNVYIPEDTIEKININSSIGDVSINNISVGQFISRTLHGKLEINSLDASKTNIESYYGDIVINSCMGDIKVQDTLGYISINQTGLYGDMDIRNDRGEVRLKIPQDYGLYLDVSTGSGKIILSDLELNIDIYHEKNLVGSSGNGGSKVMIYTGSGDIWITGK